MVISHNNGSVNGFCTVVLRLGRCTIVLVHSFSGCGSVPLILSCIIYYHISYIRIITVAPSISYYNVHYIFRSRVQPDLLWWFWFCFIPSTFPPPPWGGASFAIWLDPGFLLRDFIIYIYMYIYIFHVLLYFQRNF